MAKRSCPSGQETARNFCRQRVASPAKFDKRSLRTVVVKDHRIIVGCPKGRFDAEKQRCRVGLRMQAMLHPRGEKKRD